MKEYKRSENQAKILAAMDKVFENLLIYKKKMNSELIIIKDGKIVGIKPKDFKKYGWLKKTKVKKNTAGKTKKLK